MDEELINLGVVKVHLPGGSDTVSAANVVGIPELKCAKGNNLLDILKKLDEKLVEVIGEDTSTTTEPETPPSGGDITDPTDPTTDPENPSGGGDNPTTDPEEKEDPENPDKKDETEEPTPDPEPTPSE